MNYRLFLLSLLLLLFGCNSEVKYTSIDGNKFLIELEEFSIILPKDFKYKKIKGIDSFVGEFSNGKSKFLFDYGFFSSSPPIDKTSFLEENKKNLDISSLFKLMNQIDLYQFENEKGEINLSEIRKLVKNLELHQTTNNKFDCEYYYTLEFEDKEYEVPLCISEELEYQFDNYKWEIDTIGSYKRTISLWTDKTTSNISSLHFEPITKELNNSLTIEIDSNSQFNPEELNEIYKSIEMK